MGVGAYVHPLPLVEVGAIGGVEAGGEIAVHRDGVLQVAKVKDKVGRREKDLQTIAPGW